MFSTISYIPTFSPSDGFRSIASLDIYLKNLGVVRDEVSERFHQDLNVMVEEDIKLDRIRT